MARLHPIVAAVVVETSAGAVAAAPGTAVTPARTQARSGTHAGDLQGAQALIMEAVQVVQRMKSDPARERPSASPT